MSKDTTPDETPKQETARRVVTPKRKYFFPSTGRSVEGKDGDQDVEAAIAKHDKLNDGEQE